MYPDFVIKKSVIENEIPVFVYHKIREYEFESHLRHLKRNEYKTITCDQFYDYLLERKKLLEKSVLLTFDDGFDDLYNVVYPLLKKHGFKAVVYLITGYVGKDGMLTWQQISEMHSSGLFDFQSHSVNHAEIFINSNIRDYMGPDNQKPRDWNFPAIETINENIPLGYPFFASTSRFCDYKRFFPSDDIVFWFTSFVQDQGGNLFFKNKDWKKILFRHQLKFEKDKSLGHFESEAQQFEAIRWELLKSKEVLERQLPGKIIRHFAFPWFKKGKIAEKILAECGYRTAVIGLSKKRNFNDFTFDPFSVIRISGDFVMALPGAGRKRFSRIIFSKMKRRIFWGATA